MGRAFEERPRRCCTRPGPIVPGIGRSAYSLLPSAAAVGEVLTAPWSCRERAGSAPRGEGGVLMVVVRAVVDGCGCGRASKFVVHFANIRGPPTLNATERAPLAAVSAAALLVALPSLSASATVAPAVTPGVAVEALPRPPSEEEEKKDCGRSPAAAAAAVGAGWGDPIAASAVGAQMGISRKPGFCRGPDGTEALAGGAWASGANGLSFSPVRQWACATSAAGASAGPAAPAATAACWGCSPFAATARAVLATSLVGAGPRTSAFFSAAFAARRRARRATFAMTACSASFDAIVGPCLSTSAATSTFSGGHCEASAQQACAFSPLM